MDTVSGDLLALKLGLTEMSNMKFIGLRLCEHDSNITYSNGISVKYYKSERDYQFKHHGFRDLNQWKKIIDNWNISPSEVTAIGIVLDCFRYPNIKCNDKKLYEVIDIPFFRFLGFDCPIFRINHHYAHSLSCWTLGIKSDVDFIFDGFGDDFESHTIFKGPKKIISRSTKDFPSFGAILAEIGEILELSGSGLDHAGKIMAIKGYGNFSDTTEKFSFEENGLFKLWNYEYFSYLTKKLYDSDRSNTGFQELANYVRKCHEETERIFVDYFKSHTSENDVISYSGGVAQNTIINSEIKKVRPNLYIPPHCNDEGLSLGIVEFLRQYYDQEPFDNTGYPYWQSDEKPESDPSDETISKTARLLSEGKIVGWYQGNGEVGSRALGNRSILMDPSVRNGKEILNQKVKHREWFRPFGASILEEKTEKYFDWTGPSPYMLYVMDIFDKKSFPSITHVDGTCRIQTVSSDLNFYYRLISEFNEITGIPMLLNTSLNGGGKPICGSINGAVEIFSTTDIDVLVIGDEIYEKNY
jgi:carbamoyltransferase